jgi:hypothetical protein
LGSVSRYAASSLIVALSPGYSDVTTFQPCSPIVTRKNLDKAKKIQDVAQATGTA